MAVKASATVTLNFLVDVKAVYRYYKLQSSTAAAPTKPADNKLPDSSWSLVEPAYQNGSTNTLYTVDLTVFTDDKCSYSDVSKSSSYEAAKQAYNAAINAQSTANSAQNAVNNLEIGGRNLVSNTTDEWSDWITPTANMNNYTLNVGYLYLPENKQVGDTYTCQIEIEFSDVAAGVGGAFSIRSQGAVDDMWDKANIWNPLYLVSPPENGVYRYITVEKIQKTAVNSTKFNLGFRCNYWDGTGKFRYRKVKIEKGNKATDWTPAPEDIQQDISAVDKKFGSYITTTDALAQINTATGSILNTVSATYTTKTALEETTKTINGALELKINTTDLVSELNASADIINITGNRFIVDSNNFKLAADGTLTATNGVFNGTVNASSGSFAGTISSSTISGSNIIGGTITGTDIKSVENISCNTLNANGIQCNNDIACLGNVIASGNVRASGNFYAHDTIFFSETQCKIFTQLANTTDNLYYATSANLNGGKGYHAFYCGGTAVAYIKPDGMTVNGSYVSLNGHAHWTLNSTRSVGLGSSDVFRTYALGGSSVQDNKVACGTSGSRWTRVYAANGSIGTSDIRMKEDIKSYDERYEKLFENLEPISYRWKNDGTDSRTNHDRIHTGFIAQQVKSAMDIAGLSTQEFAGFCYDDFTTDEEWNPESTNGMTDRYSLTYEEFISLNTHMIQKTRKELFSIQSTTDLHQAQIDELQNEIYQLKQRIKQMQ